jgi:phage terminase large subunit-like protein
VGRAGEVTRAERNIAWIEAYCRVPEGSLVGQPVRLREWQRKEIRRIYDNPAGTRRAILSFGRKNGKTALSAFLLLLHLCGPEARANSQLYSAAQSRDQAAILFALAAKVVRQSPDLSTYVGVRDTAKQLHCQELGTLYRALSAEASTAYGLSPVFVVHDELGQVKGPRSELYEALETASGAQDAPLSLVISTQAPNAGDLLSILIDDALRGGDNRTVVSLYTADEALDPFGEEAIRAANPAFGDFLNAAEVMEQAAVAKRMPSREAAYRNLILNQRVNASNPLIPKGVWTAAQAEYQLSDFYGQPCWAGLDLSSTTDTTALVLVFQREGAFYTWAEFWLPEEGLLDKAKRDRVPYDVWREKGHLRTTPGRAIDHLAVIRVAVELLQDFDLRLMAYDRWGMKFLQPQLEREGIELPLEEFGQGFQSMSPAVATLESALLNGKLLHPGNPVLTFHAANAVATSDPAGNRKLDKVKATGRIDGIVALCMALAKASAAQPEQSIYNTRGLLVL